jgi:hypothetical protein
MVVSGSSLIPYINGTSMDAKTGTTGAITTLDIGGWQENNTQHWNGYIGDIIVYNSALTTSQRQQVEGYLAHKWGLTGYYNPTTPLAIPGCQLWLDGADPAGTGVRPANGTNLTTWKDKSIYNFPITSAGSSYNTTAVNGLPGINISTNPFGYNPGSAQNNWQEVFAVGLWTGGSTFNTFNGFITSCGENDGGAGGGIIFIGDGTTNWYNINAYQTPFLNGIQTNTALPTIQSPFYIRTHSTSAVNVTGLQLGVDRGNVRNWVGFISEVIMYNTALTTTQRQTIENYLAKKWGIGASSIPSTHPFRSIPPATLPFSPRNISGLAFWLDAADQNAMTLSGSSVVTVLDKSRNGKTLTGGTGWSYNVTKFNGTYPSFYRATTGSMLGQNSTFSLTSTNITLFFVGMLESAGSTTSAVYFIDGGGVDTGRFYNYVDYSGGVDTIYIYHGDTQTTASYPITNRRIVSPFIFSQSTGTNPQTGSINGIAFNASGGNTGSMTVTGLTIGGPWNSTVSGALPYTWPGHICEVLIYSSALTTSERQQVEGYLAHKWGLTGYYAPTTPLSIPGCALWLDGSDTSSMTLSGSNVTAWNDKSGNGYVMTNNQGTTSISTASLNSLTTVYTPSGTNSKITNFVGRTKCTIFLVGKAASSRYLLSLNGGFLYTANDSLLYFSPPTGNYLDLVDSVSGSIVSNNTWFILCIGYDNATNSTANPYTINGTTRSTTITPRGTPGILTDQNITSTLYINSTNGTNSYDSVYTAEILYYNDTLTTTQRQTIENYLAKKWGIGASTIPSTHPYSKLPPA